MQTKQSYIITILIQLGLALLFTACFSITALIQLKGLGNPTGDPVQYTTFNPITLLIVQTVICLAVGIIPLFSKKDNDNHKEIIWYEIPFLISTLCLMILPILSEFAASYIAEGVSSTSDTFLSLLAISIFVGLAWGVLIPVANHSLIYEKQKKLRQTNLT